MKCFLLAIAVLMFPLVLNCSGDPVAPAAPDEETLLELKALETGFAGVEMDDPGESPAVNDQRVSRLGTSLRRLQQLLKRLKTFEENHPCEEAHRAIIFGGRNLRNAAVAYRAGNYRRAFRYMVISRQAAFRALKSLRAQCRGGNS